MTITQFFALLGFAAFWGCVFLAFWTLSKKLINWFFKPIFDLIEEDVHL